MSNFNELTRENLKKLGWYWHPLIDKLIYRYDDFYSILLEPPRKFSYIDNIELNLVYTNGLRNVYINDKSFSIKTEKNKDAQYYHDVAINLITAVKLAS